MSLLPDSEVLDWLIRYGYLLMFLLMLIEGPAITASAALGAALGHFNVFVVFALSFLGNFLPDILYYTLGRWSGQWVLDRFGERIGLPSTRRERATEIIIQNMGKWLLFIKTMPFIGTPGLAAMGALEVPIRCFIWWDIVLVALTSLLFTALGYYSGKGYDFLQQAVGYGTLWLAGIFVLFLLVSYFYNRFAQRFTRNIRERAGDETPISR